MPKKMVSPCWPGSPERLGFRAARRGSRDRAPASRSGGPWVRLGLAPRHRDSVSSESGFSSFTLQLDLVKSRTVTIQVTGTVTVPFTNSSKIGAAVTDT